MNTELQVDNDHETREFVRIVLGKTRLLLPADELLVIEPAKNVKTPGDKVAYGYMEYDGLDIPVFVFDEELQLPDTTDIQYQVCVCLHNKNIRAGILCDNAAPVSMDNLKIHDLPECMIDSNSVVTSVAEYNNNLYCMIDTLCIFQAAGNPVLE